MIISHEHKFIFIHISKCAGTSIALSLEPHFADGDEIYGCTEIGERRSWRNLAEGKIWKHSKAVEIRDSVGRDVWDSYFKFAVTRNPWSRCLSQYCWWTSCKWNDDMNSGVRIRAMADFGEYVRTGIGFDSTQTRYVFDGDEIIVDCVCRHESIKEDFEMVCAHLGLDTILPHKNNTDHSSYEEYYNDELREIVGKAFAADIALFQYEFDSPAQDNFGMLK